MFTLAGYSAAQIQKYKPKTHTIVECCDVVLRRLRQFARVHPNVIVVPGTWQKQLVRTHGRDRIPKGEEAVCIVRRDAKAVDPVASDNTAEAAVLSHGMTSTAREEHPDKRSPGWAMRRFDCIFFDDFPLPIADQALQKQLQTVGTRWDIFLQYCVTNDLLAPRARVSGYLARPFVPNQNQGKFKTKLKSMRVHVPANCTYFPYKVAIIPTFTFLGRALPVPPAHRPSAKHASPDSAGTDTSTSNEAVATKKRKRPKLRLPQPKSQSLSARRKHAHPHTDPHPHRHSPPHSHALRLPAPRHDVAAPDLATDCTSNGVS